MRRQSSSCRAASSRWRISVVAAGRLRKLHAGPRRRSRQAERPAADAVENRARQLEERPEGFDAGDVQRFRAGDIVRPQGDQDVPDVVAERFGQVDRPVDGLPQKRPGGRRADAQLPDLLHRPVGHLPFGPGGDLLPVDLDPVHDPARRGRAPGRLFDDGTERPETRGIPGGFRSVDQQAHDGKIRYPRAEWQQDSADTFPQLADGVGDHLLRDLPAVDAVGPVLQRLPDLLDPAEARRGQDGDGPPRLVEQVPPTPVIGTSHRCKPFKRYCLPLPIRPPRR